METKDAKFEGWTEITGGEEVLIPLAMSRWIYCPTCHARAAALPEDPDDSEKSLVKSGLARHLMHCDLCNRPLLPGDPAHAWSMFECEDAYAAWEHKYLVLDTAQSLTR